MSDFRGAVAASGIPDTVVDTKTLNAKAVTVARSSTCGRAATEPKLNTMALPDPPKRLLTRRRVLALVCVGVAAAAMVLAWRIDEQDQPCWTVHQFIDYNRVAQASLKARTHFAAAGVQGEEDTVPTDVDYQAWLDGPQQHADRVTAPGLSEHAHRAAQLAVQFMTVAKQVNDDISNNPMLHPQLPPSAKTATTINREFDTEISSLAHSCPR